MSKKKTDPRIGLLIEILDQAFEKQAWHGTNLRGSVRGLSIKQLLWRPSPKRHNIWENLLHTAYWKYAVHRRLTGGEKGSFPRSPSDWPRIPDRLYSKAWKLDLALLNDQHKLLRQAIIDFPPSKLYSPLPTSKVKYIHLIYGISSHDLYHAGQIQLLKRMQK
jgi:hypothetical protein